MSEFRQNIITRDWVIIATDRTKRPKQFVQPGKEKSIIPLHEGTCPFCPGNEAMVEVERFRINREGEWICRVVANKYPALTEGGETRRMYKGIYRSMTASGIHDVVIEHPHHNKTLTEMTIEDIARVIGTYKQRSLEIKQLENIELITIFRNHGSMAGTSLIHPHSQIVATPIVPYQIRSRIETAIQYFDDNGECIFCRTINEELDSGERIIFTTKHFVAFIPYAALSPFHIWIFPREHRSSFEDIAEEEISDLAYNLQTVLLKLKIGLNDPDFNFTIRSIPIRERSTEYYHWYLAIVPRTAITAGFELGSGMYISAAIPEESAKFLREISIE